MADVAVYYPPSPTGVPPEITRPDAAYRGRVIAMIFGLFGFLVIYLAIIGAAGFLAYTIATIPFPKVSGRGIIVIVIAIYGSAACAAILCLFLVKGLFKGQRVPRSTYIQLSAAEFPILFEFIRRVYTEVGARPPSRVFVSPDVNAALVYDTSILNLFIPPRKDLLIGMGLVNVLNLAEFKAVLAHEFGHFAQRSVGLGSYLYVANKVMHDVIYSRDGLDRFVDTWAGIDIRVSFPAWGLKGVLWIVRQTLSGIYNSLNLLHLSLSRQMEFNADNVAVSLTGSDALIHGLYRLEFASECLADTAQSLNAAADHGLFTDDIYYHQSQSAVRLHRLRKDEKFGLPPALPTDSPEAIRLFKKEEDGIPEKYRSHPTHDMRENNAKRFYIRSPEDNRSPWLLFGLTQQDETSVRPAPVEKLNRRLAEVFYAHSLERKEEYRGQPAIEVQQFIDAEHAETTYDPKYHSWYDDRFIDPGSLNGFPDITPWPKDKISSWLANWPPANFEERIKAWRTRQQELSLLQGLKSGDLTLKEMTFTFRDEKVGKKDVSRLLKQVEEEFAEEVKSFDTLDREVFLAHWSAASNINDTARATDLIERYRFHEALQNLLRGMFTEKNRLTDIIAFINRTSQFTEADINEIQAALNGIYDSLKGNLKDSRMFNAPALTNIPAGTVLYDLIVDRSEIYLPPLAPGGVSGDWIMKLGIRLDGVTSRIKRLHFKSLGSILACQEKLAAEWLAQPVSEPTPE